MYEIRPWLFMGTYPNTQDRALLEKHQIGAMLLLHRPVEQPGIVSYYLAIDDGYPLTAAMLDKGIGFVLEQQAQEKRVLIACGSGISRSTSFAIAVLKRVEGISLTDAFWQVRAVNKSALPDEAHWQGLCAYFDETVSFWALWRDAEL